MLSTISFVTICTVAPSMITRLQQLFITLVSILLLLISVTPTRCNAASGWFDFLWHPCLFNPNAISTINATFTSHLIAQDLATTTTLSLLSDHITRIDSSEKALVLSFHGKTGTGKTYMSSLVARHLFLSASNEPSPHAHHFHGMKYSAASRVEENAEQLYDTVVTAIAHCPYSLFVFEEIHYMHPDVISRLLPLFSYHARHDQLSLTHATYIFTSNIGGAAIQKAAFDAEKQHIARHDIAYPQLLSHITASFTATPQLQLLHSHAVINHYIAFFPLFKSHVRQCTALELEERRAAMIREGQVYELVWDEAVLAYVASQLSYIGPVSVAGCKGVKDAVTTEVLGQLKRINRRVSEGSWLQRSEWTLSEYNVTLDVEAVDESAAEGAVQLQGAERVGVEERIVVRTEKVDRAKQSAALSAVEDMSKRLHSAVRSVEKHAPSFTKGKGRGGGGETVAVEADSSRPPPPRGEL